MSDNPGGLSDEEIKVRLGLDASQYSQGLEQAQQQAEGFSEATSNLFENSGDGMVQSAKDIGEAFSDLYDQQVTGWDKTTEAVQGYNEQIQSQITLMEQANALAKDHADVLLNNGEIGAGAQNIGYGAEGGLIGPGEDDGSGGGGSPSLFGAAHGIRAASGLAGLAGVPGAQGAFTGGADILYFTQGLRSIGDILPKVNEAIEATPGILTPLVEGFTAMGVEMAGLAALALPIVAVGVAIAGVVAVLKLLQEQADATSVGLQNQVKNEADFQKITTESTTKSAADIDAKQDQENSDNRSIANLQTGQIQLLADAIKKQLGDSISDAEAHRIADQQVREGTYSTNNPNADTIGDIIKQTSNTQGYKDAADAIKKYSDDASQTSQLIADAGAAILAGSNKAADAKETQQKADEQLIQTSKDATQQSQDRATLDKLTTAAANERLKQLSNEQKQLEDNATTLAKADQGNKDVQAAVQANSDALKDNAYQQKYLTSTVIPADEALDEQASTAKAAADAFKEAAAAETQRTAIVQKETDAQIQYEQSAEDAKTKEAQAEQQYNIGFTADTNARLDIATKESRQETQIKQATADADADIRAKLQDNIAAANTTLQRQMQDDTTKYNDTRAKEVRDEQDTENEDLENHLQKLADIQNQAHQNDQQAILDRNFLQLAKDKEASSQQASQENERYNTQIDDLREHLANQQRDEKIAFDQQEQQQTVNEERKRDDLELAAQQAWTQQQTDEQRKLETQRTAEQQQLDDLTTTEQRKLQLLRQGLADELTLLQQQERQKIALLQQTLNEMEPNQAPIQRTGQTAVIPQAEGGSGKAGQWFSMNEPYSSGQEFASVGGSSFGTKGGALVYPMSDWSVNANKPKQGVNHSPTYNIYESGNPQATAAYIARETQRTLEALIPNE